MTLNRYITKIEVYDETLYIKSMNYFGKCLCFEIQCTYNMYMF